MHKSYANIVKILDVCKIFSTNLVNELGSIPRCGVGPKFNSLRGLLMTISQTPVWGHLPPQKCFYFSGTWVKTIVPEK